MASDKRDDIRKFMEQAASEEGMPTGKQLVYNRLTGKFEVRSGHERPGDTVPQVSAQDMRAFGRG